MPADQLSDWGIWKRNARQYGTKRGTVLHHVRGDKKLGTPLRRISRAEHASIHNKIRRARGRG